MRSLASGKNVTQFGIATNEYAANGKERAEYHNVVTWDRLAEICGQYLGKGQQVAIEGRLQTRSWDDDRGHRQCVVVPVQFAAELPLLRCGHGSDRLASASLERSGRGERPAGARTS